MTRHSLALLLLFIFSGMIARSQPSFPPVGPVYNDQTVPRIDILINPDSLTELYDHVESNHEYPATFIFRNGTIHDTVTEVGIRLKGGTSRYSAKKSFKISFNTFVQGRKFYGLEKMNLNGEHNDPSVIRSKLCWDLFRKFNIPGARANHVRVYINNNFYGVYISVEDIDDCFVKSRFGNKDGNLFKCLYPADLAYLGSNPDLYKKMSGSRRVYELQTNEELDDYSDLAHFIDVLNNTPLSQLKCELDKVLNVNDYLKVAAMDIFIAQWDGYIFNKNNFYLYHNAATGKFEVIPYDLDNTYGIEWSGIDWGTRNIYSWAPGGSETRPLYTRLLAVQEYKDKFSWYLHELITTVADPATFFPRIDSLKNMIEPYMAIDPYYPLDYGFNMTSFNNSYTQALGAHVTYGLKPYITTRISSANAQLVLNNIFPVIKYIWNNHPRVGQDIIVRAFSEDDDPSLVVRLRFTMNSGSADSVQMYDDGLHMDLQAGDKIYGAVHAPFSAGGTFDYQIVAVDIAGKRAMIPCEFAGMNIYESGNVRLKINEFMADNTHTIADDAGDYDDWLEIFNADTVPVWLGDKYLSDNLQVPDKWLMPDYTMQPGSFCLFWADEDGSQGSFHANFKISKSGEELGIFDNPSYGSALIDSIGFGPQATDISYGRLTDGGPDWVVFTNPTPGYSNVPGGMEDPGNPEGPVVAYPNPNGSGILYFSKRTDFVLYTMVGTRLLEERKSDKADISRLKPGIYLVRTGSGDTIKLLITN